MKIPDRVKQLFDEVPVMAFSTADKSGVPNVVAIASQKVVNEDTIWVIDTFFKKTLQNLFENNKVAIAFWKGKEGYQIKGLARYHTQGNVFEKAKEWILKLKPHKIVKGVVEVKVTEVYSITPTYEEAGKRVA